MPASAKRLNTLKARFASGTYGKIELATAAILVLVGFIGMIVISAWDMEGNTTTSSSSEKYRDLWVENATEIKFPPFRFTFGRDWAYRSDPDGQWDNKFQSISCQHHRGHPSRWYDIPTDNCDLNQTCKVVKPTPEVVAHFYEGERLECNITATHPPGWTHNNTNLVWELDPSALPQNNPGWYGPWTANQPQYIHETKGAWIYLTKTTEVDDKGNEDVIWRHSLAFSDNAINHNYSDPTVTVASYRVTVVMTGVGVHHWVHRPPPAPTAFGVSLGGIVKVGVFGGFWVFLYFIHQVVMLLVGLVLDDDGDVGYAKV